MTANELVSDSDSSVSESPAARPSRKNCPGLKGSDEGFDMQGTCLTCLYLFFLKLS